MSDRIRVALVYGGKTSEHEVSLVSAASVYQHLDRARYDLVPIAIDKAGRLHLHQDEDLKGYKEKLPVQTDKSLPMHALIDNASFCRPVDVVVPILHGRDYEDGCLQGLLRQANVAFVGCDVLGSAIGMSKDCAKILACHGDVEGADYVLLQKNMPDTEKNALIDEAVNRLSWPIFVKPSCAGSSIGIHKAKHFTELLSSIEDAFLYDEEVLLETCIEGREIEVAVLENYREQKIEASLPGEIRVHHPDGFYSYAAKYIQSSQSEYMIPASISSEWIAKIQVAAINIFKRLKCKGMARVDFFFDEKNQKLYFNEVNTIPGFTAISLYPQMWAKTGLPYAKLLDSLIDTAILQQKTRSALLTSFQA
ncbi:MAG: D-alanine--D-alanine ligase [Gammaproteobacteria bacterium]|nr:D-alanine--D-alanine ligase [Gammaproteobacteria bacterium]